MWGGVVGVSQCVCVPDRNDLKLGTEVVLNTVAAY